jgi:DNA invertase Pin-like site-specific DNA recombinase
MTRVAIYARYSSDRQRDAWIEDQQRVCRAYAARAGWTIVEEFADRALSGATINRPDFKKLNVAIRAGTFDIVLAESLDRFSRDLEHIAAFHKLCIFQQVRIYLASEGEVSELHIGLKGTMGALYLEDLSDKTRRGLEGRIHAGRSIGTPPYGYEVVRKLGDNGELERGLRAIDPDKASLVRRIFEAYAGGASPRRIARSLNSKSVTGPGGGIWYDSSILGRPKRVDGLLRNELYVARLVWRRRVNANDPSVGQSCGATHVPKISWSRRCRICGLLTILCGSASNCGCKLKPRRLKPGRTANGTHFGIAAGRVICSRERSFAVYVADRSRCSARIISAAWPRLMAHAATPVVFGEGHSKCGSWTRSVGS